MRVCLMLQIRWMSLVLHVSSMSYPGLRGYETLAHSSTSSSTANSSSRKWESREKARLGAAHLIGAAAQLWHLTQISCVGRIEFIAWRLLASRETNKFIHDQLLEHMP